MVAWWDKQGKRLYGMGKWWLDRCKQFHGFGKLGCGDVNGGLVGVKVTWWGKRWLGRGKYWHG